MAPIDILKKLIGNVTEKTAEQMNNNLECFLHPNVSLFIPSSGQCKYAIMPSHIHPAYTFIYYFQPVNNFVVEGKHISYDLADGKCLTAMSPMIPHQEDEEEYFQSYIAVAIDAELFENTSRQYIEKVPVFKGEIFAPHPELLNQLRCFMLASSETKTRNEELLNGLTAVITHLVACSLTSETQQTVLLYDRFEIDKAIAYMNSRIADKMTVEDLAQQVNLSAGHFSKVFKAVTGETPIDFLNMLRLQKARSMLMNNANNITEVALNCGFGSSSYFSTCFLEKYKMTPSIYRQQILKADKAQDI